MKVTNHKKIYNHKIHQSNYQPVNQFTIYNNEDTTLPPQPIEAVCQSTNKDTPQTALQTTNRYINQAIPQTTQQPTNKATLQQHKSHQSTPLYIQYEEEGIASQVMQQSSNQATHQPNYQPYYLQNHNMFATTDAIDEVLNARYNDLSSLSNNPAYYYNGIVLHTIENATDTWYPPAKAEDTGRVSFSYLRKDITYGVSNPIWGTNNPDIFTHGYIFSPCNASNYQGLCFYPIDGFTYNRAYCGCGATEELTPENSNCEGLTNLGSCASMGVLTAQQFLNAYTENNSERPTLNQSKMCSFNASSQAAFYQGMQVILQMQTANYDHLVNNELVVKQWRGLAADLIPIEAFFCLKTATGGFVDNKSKGAALNLRDAYYRASGRFLHVVSIDNEIITSGDTSTYLQPFKIVELD
ncbi:hypothetical protein HAV_01000 [Candidatus Hepatincola sp. Av]